MSAIIQGKGDVFGPVGAVDGNIPVFDGASGKIIKDGWNKTFTVAGFAYRPSGLIYVNNSLTSNNSTSEFTFWTFSLPAGMMGRDGDVLIIDFYIKGTSSVVSKSVRLRWDGVQLLLHSSATASPSWHYRFIISRIDATNQRVVFSSDYVDASVTSGNVDAFTATANLVNSIPVSVTGISSTANLIFHHLSTIQFLPAP